MWGAASVRCELRLLCHRVYSISHTCWKNLLTVEWGKLVWLLGAKLTVWIRAALAELTHGRPPRTTHDYLIRHEKWKGEMSSRAEVAAKASFYFREKLLRVVKLTVSWTLQTKPSVLNVITHTSVIRLTTRCSYMDLSGTIKISK